MKRHIAFWVSAMMTVNLFTAVPAFATDDFSDVEVAVQEDSNEDAEEMEIQINLYLQKLIACQHDG